ncbi:MAG: response regulator [Verrucomicrobiae bacterium]|nr:response regulator [Verrucomicrobiae bacterium]
MSEPTQKKRVLLVDDERMVLNVYQTALRRASPQWEVEVAESGPKALEMMQNQAYDIVVTDMRMPEMSGAQFLAEVQQRHPATARVVLTGYTEQERVLQSIGSVHQWLSKPCNVKTLQNTLARIFDLQAHIHEPWIKEMAGKIRSLPSLPDLFFRVLDELQTPYSTPEQIASFVCRDAGMTARLLQLVNSAFFGFSQPVRDVTEAVQLLGVGTVRALALSMKVFSCFDVKDYPGLDAHKLYYESLVVGTLARNLLAVDSAETPEQEAAFTAGLLRGVGCLVLATTLKETYAGLLSEAVRSRHPLPEVEHKALGITHAEVGAYLMGLWGLPVQITEAIGFQYRPSSSANRGLNALTGLHVAQAIVGASHAHDSLQLSVPLDEAYLRECGLEQHLPRWQALFHQRDRQTPN